MCLFTKFNLINWPLESVQITNMFIKMLKKFCSDYYSERNYIDRLTGFYMCVGIETANGYKMSV